MKSTSIKEEIKKLDNIVKYVLFIGLPILIILPIVATQLEWFFDFTNTGQIGDTIGGLTAPVIGVLSALLIYFSFRAQINANKIIQEQIDNQEKKEIENRSVEIIQLLYKTFKEEVDGYIYVRHGHPLLNKKSTSYNGTEAIDEFLYDIGKNNLYSDLKELRTIGSFVNFEGILMIAESLIEKFMSAQINKVDLEYLIILFEHQYVFKLLNFVDRSVELETKCRECGKLHITLPCFLYKRIYKIKNNIRKIEKVKDN